MAHSNSLAATGHNFIVSRLQQHDLNQFNNNHNDDYTPGLQHSNDNSHHNYFTSQLFNYHND
jgi:hypothetical protein